MRRQQSFAILSLGKAFYSETAAESGVQKFRILPRYHAPMIWFRATLPLTNRCFLLSYRAMIVDAAWKGETVRTQYPGRRIAIVADHYRLSEWLSSISGSGTDYSSPHDLEVFIHPWNW